MTFQELKNAIFNTLVFDSTRGGHTVETLIPVICFSGAPQELAVRLYVAELLQSGELDMRSDGVLLLPAEQPEEGVECYAGAWWSAVTGRRIGGSLSNQKGGFA